MTLSWISLPKRIWKAEDTRSVVNAQSGLTHLIRLVYLAFTVLVWPTGTASANLQNNINLRGSFLHWLQEPRWTCSVPLRNEQQWKNKLRSDVHQVLRQRQRWALQTRVSQEMLGPSVRWPLLPCGSSDLSSGTKHWSLDQTSIFHFSFFWLHCSQRKNKSRNVLATFSLLQCLGGMTSCLKTPLQCRGPSSISGRYTEGIVCQDRVSLILQRLTIPAPLILID